MFFVEIPSLTKEEDFFAILEDVWVKFDECVNNPHAGVKLDGVRQGVAVRQRVVEAYLSSIRSKSVPEFNVEDSR